MCGPRREGSLDDLPAVNASLFEVKGRVFAVVVYTGDSTALGNIAQSAATALSLTCLSREEQLCRPYAKAKGNSMSDERISQ